MPGNQQNVLISFGNMKLLSSAIQEVNQQVWYVAHIPSHAEKLVELALHHSVHHQDEKTIAMTLFNIKCFWLASEQRTPEHLTGFVVELENTKPYIHLTGFGWWEPSFSYPRVTH